MSLLIYKPHFDNAYQETVNKVMVGLKIANLRFEKVLTYGESIERVAYDASTVRVRTVVRGNASTIDSITDTSQLLEINLEKEAVFYVSDGEVKQAGPLNPGEVIGAQIGIKISVDLDARILAEVLNATYTFDTGDLTTLVSNGTPISMTAANVPLMITRAPAKLRKNNQNLMDLVWVIDSYGAADFESYLLSKNIDISASTFKNGYAGKVVNAEVYISENLTGSAVLALATTPTDNDTVVINGITYTFKTTLGSTAGNVLIDGSADAARANLTYAINNPGTTNSQSVAVSAANIILIQDNFKFTATNNDTTNLMTLVGIGAGALTISETLTDATDAWTLNKIHAYFGRRGAIDVVVQDMKKSDMRPTSDRRGTNIFSSYLAGIKTFADGAKKFCNVLILR